ncbi:MAG: hypothetical protein C0410_14900, partial [Anaerolinea sp.]|nr:hypothetical protein [Anaerolinea sp.]
MGKLSANTKTNQPDQNINFIPSFQQLVETAMEGVWVTNQHDETTYVNASICNLLGYTQKEILQHPISRFLFEKDLANHAQKLLDRKKGITESYERQLKKKDGTPIWMLMSAKPLYDDNGKFAGSFVHLIDISDQKRRDRLGQLVTEVQLSLAQASDIDDVYDMVGRKINELIPEGLVGVSRIDDNRSVVKITHLFGVGQKYLDLVKSFRIDPTKIEYPLKGALEYQL